MREFTKSALLRFLVCVVVLRELPALDSFALFFSLPCNL